MLAHYFVINITGNVFIIVFVTKINKKLFYLRQKKIEQVTAASTTSLGTVNGCAMSLRR